MDGGIDPFIEAYLKELGGSPGTNANGAGNAA
jgi:hypothetical protein